MNPLHREHQELHGLRGNRYYREYQRKQRIENKLVGKTWNGKERRRPLRMDLLGLDRNQRHVITNRARRQKLRISKAS